MTEAHHDKSPPWVLFVDDGRPIAILPAGRPGEVANVEHMSMAQAQRLVGLANEMHHMLLMSRLEHLNATIVAATDELRKTNRRTTKRGRLRP